MKFGFEGKKVLVTGGAGFVGSHLCDYVYGLSPKELIIVDDLTVGKMEFLENLMGRPNAKFFKADVRDKEMGKLLEGVDTVFHLACRNVTHSITDPKTDLEVNANGTLNMLTHSVSNNVKRFVYSSSASVYGTQKIFPEAEETALRPLSPYAVSKLAGENYTLLFNKMHGLKTSALRYFNIYGPRQHHTYYGGVISRFASQILASKPPEVYGDGTQTRDFTYVSDCVEATVAAAFYDEAIGEAINVCSGNEVSMNDLAKMMIKISGKSLAPKYLEQRKTIDDISRRVGSNAKAKKLLRFQPKVSLEQGMTNTYNWFSKKQA
jgi:UDP-N-acetylglucosamine/UDP-N-acetylgalactosamine 4-epimerase